MSALKVAVYLVKITVRADDGRATPPPLDDVNDATEKAIAALIEAPEGVEVTVRSSAERVDA